MGRECSLEPDASEASVEINPYLLLIALAVILVVIAAAGLRLIIRSLPARRDVPAAARRSGPTASDYYAGTLRQAAEVVGGEDPLAHALDVSPEALRQWLAGEASPPIEVHLAALDLVTRGAPHEKAE
jgi:hypothetical protein